MPGERNLYSDLMDEFTAKGHQVFVAGTIQSDTEHKSILTEEKGIRVLRIPSGKIMKTSHFKKAKSLLSLGSKFNRSILKHFGEETFHLIIAPTPPITLSYLFRKLKRRYKASFYLLVKDIWPQGSVDLKVFPKYGIIWTYLRYHEIRSYSAADIIGTMSPMNMDYLLKKNRFLANKVVEVCPNSIRPSENMPTIDNKSIRAKYGIPVDACVFIFSGNLGKGHGLQFLVDAIRQLSDYPGAFFLIGGSGTHFDFLEKEFQHAAFSNVFLYKRLPKADFDQLLGTSNVGLILLDSKYTIPQFPSRLLSYLDSGKPVLCAANESTDMGRILEEYSCGRSVDHGDLTSFIREIKYLSENHAIREKMGKESSVLLHDQYTVKRSTQIIMKHLK